MDHHPNCSPLNYKWASLTWSIIIVNRWSGLNRYLIWQIRLKFIYQILSLVILIERIWQKYFEIYFINYLRAFNEFGLARAYYLSHFHAWEGRWNKIISQKSLSKFYNIGKRIIQFVCILDRISCQNIAMLWRTGNKR